METGDLKMTPLTQLNVLNRDIPCRIPSAVDPSDLAETIAKAHERISCFAEKHDWKQHAAESFIDRVEQYDSKPEFDARLREIMHIDPAFQIPATYSAVLENRMLILVTPDLYLKNYPEGEESGYYEKIIAHEIAHRLHIRILGGNEEAMGPIWFFEGFAILAADQFSADPLELDAREIHRILYSTDRGSYRKYNVVLRHLLHKHPLEFLVREAGTADFLNKLNLGFHE